MSSEIRWSDAETGRTVVMSSSPTEASQAMLSQTIWGSRASRYRILGLREKLDRLRNPSFFTLNEGARELGVIVVDYCTKHIGGRPVGAYHFVMAATDPERRREGIAGIILEEVRRYCLETVGHPGYGFAYVEATTEISLRLSDSIGHVVEAEIPLTLFSRLFPRDTPEVVPLAEAEVADMVDRLSGFYADHELADFDRSLDREEYFVLKKDGKIVAGVQAEVIRWSVVDMPGLAGWFLLKVFARIPGSGAILDLQDLRIVRMGSIFVARHCEAQLVRLMSAVLARHRSKLGLTFLDCRSPLLRRIRAFGHLGILSGALTGSVKIRIDIAEMEDDMLERLSTRPLLFSPADVV